jgi:hypothetical protein
VHVIEHRHRVAAVSADRVHYSPHIEVLEPDHPERRFVAARFARAMLMPAEEFAPVIGWRDAELAELLRGTARPGRHSSH